MNAVLDPIISEFETENQAASYDLWFRGQVQQALESKAPRIPHDQVMAEMEAIIVKETLHKSTQLQLKPATWLIKYKA